MREYTSTAETWCIFNDTATDAGLDNALTLKETPAL